MAKTFITEKKGQEPFKEKLAEVVVIIVFSIY